MSNVALIGPFVCVYFYLLRFFNFWSLTVFIYVVLGYHIRGCNKVVYNLDARFERSPVRVPAVSLFYVRITTLGVLFARMFLGYPGLGKICTTSYSGF